jgi:hypothetical protein
MVPVARGRIAECAPLVETRPELREHGVAKVIGAEEARVGLERERHDVRVKARVHLRAAHAIEAREGPADVAAAPREQADEVPHFLVTLGRESERIRVVELALPLEAVQHLPYLRLLLVFAVSCMSYGIGSVMGSMASELFPTHLAQHRSGLLAKRSVGASSRASSCGASLD